MADAFLTVIARAQAAALQQFGVRVVDDVATADEPVTLAQAYKHCRIDTVTDSNGTTSDDDDWLSDIGIPAAREWCEVYLGFSLAPRTVELSSNAFPTAAVATPPGPFIPLPFGPVQSITSVKYLADVPVLDSNGDPVLDSSGDAVTEVVEQTLDASVYALDLYVTPNRLVLAVDQSWPTDAINAQNSVKVRYVVGEADSNGTIIPKMAKAAIVVLLAFLYDNRGDAPAGALNDIPPHVTALLDLVPGRQRLGFA